MVRGSERPGSRFGCALLFALSACAGGDRDAGAAESSSRQDSAGVTILTTSGTTAFAPLEREVDSLPDLVLGSDDSPGGYFHQVRGVKALPDGSFIVLDGGNHELRLFDGGGRLLATAGGEGGGPGEFSGPFLVPSADGDSVLVFDQYNLRFQVFSTDLDGNRTQRAEDWAHGRRPPLGAVGLRTLRERRQYNGGTLESTMYIEGPIEESREFFWYDPVTGATSYLDSFSAVRMYVDRYGLGPLIPFAPDPAATVGPDFAAITNGRTYEIRQFDLHGRLRRILRIGDDPEPVGAEILEAKIRLELSTLSEPNQRRARVRYSEQPIPDEEPAFRSLIVDELGWLWAKTYDWDPDQPKKWVLFDPDGRARGTVQTPADLEVHSITRDHVYGVWRSEFDVEYVHRHRLRRTGR